MKSKIFVFLLIFCFQSIYLLAGHKLPDESNFLKGSEVYLSFLKRINDDTYFVDSFINKEVNPRMRFSIWRNDKRNIIMNFGAQSLFAPNLDSTFFVSLVSFEIGIDYYQNLGNSGRYKIRGFLIHRSQHVLDLPRLGIEIPESVNEDLENNVFHDLNILGIGIERSGLSGDKLRYNFRAYIQPYNSKVPNFGRGNAYKRPLFIDSEIFSPFWFTSNRLSFYNSGEFGKSSSVGTLEARLYLLKNLVIFARKSFISGNNEAIVTPHNGVVYRGFNVGFFVKVGDLFIP